MNQYSSPTNRLPNKYNPPTKVKKITVVFAALGILLYFADVVSDICLAVRYYNTGHKTFFCLTLFLVILSAVVSSLLSFYMYWKTNEDTASKIVWIIRAVFLIFGIAPVLRFVLKRTIVYFVYYKKSKSAFFLIVKVLHF